MLEVATAERGGRLGIIPRVACASPRAPVSRDAPGISMRGELTDLPDSGTEAGIFSKSFTN
jgi:hypothetical protein